MAPNLPKKHERQKFSENKHQNRNKHIAMYPCTKFHLIWRTSDFGKKFAQKDMNDKNFGKINIKFEMRI